MPTLKSAVNETRKSRASEPPKAHGEAEVTRIAVESLSGLDLPADEGELSKLRKGDVRKVLVACLLRLPTAGNQRIAKRLTMSHPSSVSRLVSVAAKDRPTIVN
jgi:hypothetical protein